MKLFHLELNVGKYEDIYTDCMGSYTSEELRKEARSRLENEIKKAKQDENYQTKLGHVYNLDYGIYEWESELNKDLF